MDACGDEEKTVGAGAGGPRAPELVGGSAGGRPVALALGKRCTLAPTLDALKARSII